MIALADRLRPARRWTGFLRRASLARNIPGSNSIEGTDALHFMILSHDLTKSPSQGRPGDVHVVVDAGVAVYAGPDADEVPGLSAALVADLDAHPDADPVHRGDRLPPPPADIRLVDHS